MMPDGICKVHCEAVDKKLDTVWESMGKKVPYLVFSLVLGGLLLVAIFFGETFARRQEKSIDALIAIQSDISGNKGERAA